MRIRNNGEMIKYTVIDVYNNKFKDKGWITTPFYFLQNLFFPHFSVFFFTDSEREFKQKISKAYIHKYLT